MFDIDVYNTALCLLKILRLKFGPTFDAEVCLRLKFGRSGDIGESTRPLGPFCFWQCFTFRLEKDTSCCLTWPLPNQDLAGPWAASPWDRTLALTTCVRAIVKWPLGQFSGTTSSRTWPMPRFWWTSTTSWCYCGTSESDI